MRELVTVLCRGLGVSLEGADLEERREGEDVTVALSLPLEDLRKLDGREHRVARAVRQVLATAASAGKGRFHLVARARD